MRADGAKATADARYEEKQKEMAKAAVGGLTLDQKARFDEQLNALMAKKTKAINEATDAADVQAQAESS